MIKGCLVTLAIPFISSSFGAKLSGQPPDSILPMLSSGSFWDNMNSDNEWNIIAKCLTGNFLHGTRGAFFPYLYNPYPTPKHPNNDNPLYIPLYVYSDPNLSTRNSLLLDNTKFSAI